MLKKSKKSNLFFVFLNSIKLKNWKRIVTPKQMFVNTWTTYGESYICI